MKSHHDVIMEEKDDVTHFLFVLHVSPFLQQSNILRLLSRSFHYYYEHWVAYNHDQAERSVPAIGVVTSVIQRHQRLLGIPYYKNFQCRPQIMIKQSEAVEFATRLERRIEFELCNCQITPNSNVGTLDTTRTIERLTQARLSRFHTTGAMHVSFLKSGSIDSMIHPVSAATSSKMLIFFRRDRLNTADLKCVLNVVRNNIIHVCLHTIVETTEFIMNDISPVILKIFETYCERKFSFCVGLRFKLNTNILYQHTLHPGHVAKIINDGFRGIASLARFEGESCYLYIISTTFSQLQTSCYKTVLPTLIHKMPGSEDACVRDLVAEMVFDTSTTSIRQKMRPPVLSRSDMESIQAHRVNNRHVVNGTTTRRTAKRGCSTDATDSFEVLGAVRGHRRRTFSGTRPPSRKSSGGSEVIANVTKTFVCALIRWLHAVFSQVLINYELGILTDESTSTKLKRWRDEAVDLQSDDHSMNRLCDSWRSNEIVASVDDNSLQFIVCHIICRVAYILDNVSATSTRQELIKNVMNEAVYHTCNKSLVVNFLKYQIKPRLLNTTLQGISGISAAYMNFNADTSEWALCTEGSAFQCLINSASPYIDIYRCLTTSIPCILATIGIEAVYALFTNGQLAESLGVSNHCCKLLASHISQRGFFRGINRSSIIAHNSVLNSISVEDPCRHIAVAAVCGQTDNCLGSSANVLIGKSVNCGTSGTQLLFSV